MSLPVSACPGRLMIPSFASGVFQKNLQEKLLFCPGKMQRGNFIQVTVNIINMMFHTDADTSGKIYKNPWLKNTNSTVTGQVLIIMDPVIIPIKTKAYKFCKMKHLFNLCFQSAAKIIIPEERCVGPKAGIIACQRHSSQVQ